jgi:hypothetical protein
MPSVKDDRLARRPALGRAQGIAASAFEAFAPLPMLVGFAGFGGASGTAGWFLRHGGIP